MRRPAFSEIWTRIEKLAGEEFTTISGLPFTYETSGDALFPSRTEYRLSKEDFKTAYSRVPIPGPGIINNEVRGPSYIWAILHDQRISRGDW